MMVCGNDGEMEPSTRLKIFTMEIRETWDDRAVTRRLPFR
jgi:hypothetical protein